VARQIAGATQQLEEKFNQQQRFYADQQLLKFQQGLNDDLVQRGRAYDPASGATFVTDTASIIGERKKEFLASLPQQLQQEYSVRADQVAAPVHSQALKFQLDAMDDYSRNGLAQAYDAARLSLDQDGSAANLDAQRAKLDLLISSSGLSVAEQTALRRQYYSGIEVISYKSEVRNKRLTSDALGVGSPAQAASLDLIENFTQESPEVVKAIAAAAEETITKSVNPLIWEAQSDPVKAALLSLVAYKRELPDSVKTALESGDKNKLAQAVEDLGGEQHKTEAGIIRGDLNLPVSQLDADPRYANIPYEDRLAARRDADTEAAADATKQAQATKAQHNAITNALFVSLANGTAGQADIDALREAGVLSDIDDINKAQETLKKYQGDVGLAAQGMQMLQNGIIFNPTDPDHVKIENALVGTQGLAAIQKMDSDYTAKTLVPMVRQMQDIPTDVVGTLTGMVRNANQQKSLWAYDLLTELQQAAPQAFDARTNEALAKDVEFYRNAKDFYPADKLQEMLRGGDSQEERVRNDTLRAKAHEILTNPTTSAVAMQGVQKSLTDMGWFKSPANVPVAGYAINSFQADYQELFTDAFARYGDTNLARDAATSLIKKAWGVTSVGGNPVLMKYPPDKVGYTPIDGSYDWITRQVREDLNIAPDESFQLVSDAQTEREYEQWRLGQGPAPSYMVVINGSDGVVRAWAPDKNGQHQARRVWFDPSLEVAAQTADWLKKRAALGISTAQQTLSEAVQHQQETGHPIPEDVLHDNISSMEQQLNILPMGTISATP
jgi:hypothetical protein